MRLKSNIDKNKKMLTIFMFVYLIVNSLYCVFFCSVSQTEWYRLKFMLLFRPFFNLPFIAEALIWHIFISCITWLRSKIERNTYENAGFVSNTVIFFCVLTIRLVISMILSIFGTIIRFGLPYSLISGVLSIWYGYRMATVGTVLSSDD